jgi:hypothetical protein
MKKISFFLFLFIYGLEKLKMQTIIKQNYGVYKIVNLLNKNYLSNENIINFVSKISYFRIIEFKSNPNNYLIEERNKKKCLGINEEGNVLLYDKKEIINITQIIWKLIKKIIS